MARRLVNAEIPWDGIAVFTRVCILEGGAGLSEAGYSWQRHSIDSTLDQYGD